MTCPRYISVIYDIVHFFLVLFLMVILLQALVKMRVLQDRCMANKGVICRFHKCQEIENKERDQYMEAVCTLNKELTDTQAMLK